MSGKSSSVDRTYKQISLLSRSNREHEVYHMQRVLDAMPEVARCTIESIFCDSKDCATYDVTFCMRRYSDEVADLIEVAFRECGAFNTRLRFVVGKRPSVTAIV